ncbi:MAG: cyclic nucleotide-binding domain-containing protein [Proteobacteria bacterium]|nr:cyclic nucleotide-binding domain-containing protein [Pseudomonadota bacterium]
MKHDAIHFTTLNMAFALSLAIFTGIWLPVRMVLFPTLNQLDIIIDLIVMAYASNLIRKRITTYRTHHHIGIRRSLGDLFFTVFGYLLVGLPLVSGFKIFAIDASFLFILKLLILKELVHIRSMADRLEIFHPVISRLIPLAFIMPILVHVIACGWIALGSGTSGTEPDKFLEYSRAAYWAITTLATVGYGDIAAKTVPQMAYAACTMTLGVGFFGFVLSNVASLLARIDAARIQQDEILDNVEGFMRYNQVPDELRGKVRSYYRYLFQNNYGFDNKVMQNLPRSLRTEVAVFLNFPLIRKVPILSGADPEFVRDIVLELKPIVVVPGEKIFSCGDVGDSIYFILKGVVNIVSKDGKLLASLSDGQFFGETALLTSNPRSATALSVNYCDLYVLSREAFETVLAHHEDFRSRLQKNYSSDPA